MNVLLSACHQQELLQNLTEQQANDVIAVLQVHDLSVQKQNLGKAGYAVNVDQSDFPSAVDLLHQYNLPAQTRTQISQAFPSDALVASPLAEQARLLSAVEQRLEQNLSALKNVVRARVQLSYPLSSSDDGTNARMHAAILLAYRNEVNEDILVAEAKRFVKNSFANIDYDDISVILYPAQSLFHGGPTQATSHFSLTWLYLLVGILVSLVAAGSFWIVYRRRVRDRTTHISTVRAEPTVHETSSVSL